MGTIRDIRLTLGLSQKAMARMIGVGRSMLALAETGRRRLPLAAWDILRKLETTINADLVHADATVSEARRIWRLLMADKLRSALEKNRQELKWMLVGFSRLERDHKMAKKTLAVILGHNNSTGKDLALYAHHKAALVLINTELEMEQLQHEMDIIKLRITYAETWLETNYPQ